MRLTIRLLMIVAGLAGTLPATLHADIFEPFTTTNLNPFVQPYGPPAPGSADSRSHVSLSTTLANSFTSSSHNTEAIAIDGETLRIALAAQWKVSERWAVGLEIPYYRYSGGRLDQFIENWHDLFGLPGGGRGDHPRNRLQYAYSGQTGLTSRSGIGDVSVFGSYQFNQGPGHGWAARAGVSFPTGDSDNLTGSGSTDVFASLHYSSRRAFNLERMTFHGSLGLLKPGSGDVLDEILENAVVFGSVTLAWHAWERIALKTQMDFHSAMFDSNLRELGKFSTQLQLGGTIELGERTFLDLAVSEDIVTDTSPDVAFFLNLSRSL